MVFAPIYMLGMFATAFSKGRWAAPFVAVMLCVLTSTATSYADLQAYIGYFDVIQSGGTPSGIMELPVGWLAVCTVLSSLGLTARGMVCVVLIASIGMVARFFQRVGCDTNLHWALFMLFPALVQCVQLRFFLGFSIVLLSFAGIANGERFGVRRFVLGVLVASLIHSSALVFLVLAPSGALGSLGRKKAVLIVLSLAIVTYFAVGYVPGVAETVLNDVKYERYFNSGTSVTTLAWFVKIACIWAASLGLSYASIRILDKGMVGAGLFALSNDKRQSTLLIGVALLGLTLPLLQFDSNFHRFIEMGYMFTYVLFSYVWQSASLSASRKLLLLLCVLAVGLVAAYVYMPVETVVKPLLSFDGFYPLFT